MRNVAFFMLLGLLGACGTPGGPYPSLQPRATEQLDPRVPVERPLNDRPVGAAVAARLAALVSQARAGDAAFQDAAVHARRLAETAGAPQSEGWIAAQEALSAAVAARGATTTALGDIDRIAGDALQSQGGMSPNDLGAIRAAGAEVGAIDRRQAETVRSIQQQLGR